MVHIYRSISLEGRPWGSQGESLKAYIHAQFLLLFLAQFSPFEGCERVNQL